VTPDSTPPAIGWSGSGGGDRAGPRPRVCRGRRHRVDRVQRVDRPAPTGAGRGRACELAGPAHQRHAVGVAGQPGSDEDREATHRRGQELGSGPAPAGPLDRGGPLTDAGVVPARRVVVGRSGAARRAERGAAHGLGVAGSPGRVAPIGRGRAGATSACASRPRQERRPEHGEERARHQQVDHEAREEDPHGATQRSEQDARERRTPDRHERTDRQATSGLMCLHVVGSPFDRTVMEVCVCPIKKHPPAPPRCLRSARRL